MGNKKNRKKYKKLSKKELISMIINANEAINKAHKSHKEQWIALSDADEASRPERKSTWQFIGRIDTKLEA